MGFREGAYAKVWEVEDKGKYHNIRISISKKNKTTNEYEQDFSGYVRLVATAHDLAKNLQENDRIKIGGCDVTTNYNKEKNITYTNFTMFSYEDASGDNSKPPQSTSDNTKSEANDDASDDDLPF